MGEATNMQSTSIDLLFRFAPHPFGLALTLLIAYFSWNLFFNPLSSIPGPLSARLGLPTFRIIASYQQSYSWRLKSLHDKYGDTVRVGPNFVSTINPAAVHSIYAYGSNFSKTKFYLSFQAIKNRPSLFSDIDPHSHGARRRSVAHVYSMKSLIDLEHFVEPCVGHVVQAFNQRMKVPPTQDDDESLQKHTNAIELNQWFQFFAADAVGELAFGRGFGLLKSSGKTGSFLRAVYNAQSFGAIAGCVPSIASFVSFLLRRSATHSPRVIRDLTRERVEERYKELQTFFNEDGTPQRRDLLTGFIQSKSPKTQMPYTPEEVAAISTSVLGAGSETTAATLTSLFYFILKNPAIYRRLQQEIDSAFETGHLHLPVKYAQSVKLPYLQACLKEAMRLLPPVGMEMPRLVPEEGLVIRMHVLPKGTEVGTSAFVYHRTSETFGLDAEVFRPDRWLEISEDERARMERNFLAFGAGSRICIGKNISLMEMSKLLPTLLWCYSFALTPRSPSGPHLYEFGRGLDGVESKDEPWRLFSTFATRPEDFWCDVTMRKEAEEVLAAYSEL